MILFDNFELISPGMQSAVCVTVSQVNCSFFEVWRQEKRCFHAQRIKDMLFAVYDQSRSANIESCEVQHVPELLQGLPRYLFHKKTGNFSTPSVDNYFTKRHSF